MTRYEKFLQELTEEKMIDLLDSQIGEELYNGKPGWCGGEQEKICSDMPDSEPLPCRECIRKWLREKVS